ncbi:MAG TPA: acetyl-CoA C-acyltransferase [Candidatus Acidoferrales bacterium]|jgi:acetyl-CoA acyltransferase 2|nr:acetyl-CoA C-acyltransferase [Candidatus Acidoferrales bacterium]
MSVALKDAEIVILAGARTPFGNLGGALADLSATDLAVAAAEAAIERSGVSRESIDEVVFGNVIQTSADAIYLARHVGLRAGLPIGVPALTVNRLCGSGLQAILSAAQSLALGSAAYALAGGAENMSQAPHVVRGARKGFHLGQNVAFEDSLWTALSDSYGNTPMAVTAENLAKKYGISRQESDEFALVSQERALAAQDNGYFAEEIVPVEVPGPKGTTVRIERDEGPRQGLTLEKLAKLPARFVKDGVVTPGNASGITDGAAAVVLTTRKRAEADGLPWLGRLVSASVVGVDPAIMGIGPAFSIPKALQSGGVAMNDVAVVEINEAFAPQVIACLRELDASTGSAQAKLNPHGGAIALGHPLGASGARLALTTLHELRERGGGYGIASACIGGGQGIAALLSVE